LNNEACYIAIRDAGIRAGTALSESSLLLAPFDIIISELLLTLLASRAFSEEPSSLVLKTADFTATGSTDAFMLSRLRFTDGSQGQQICLLSTEDGDVGVMMGWERAISAFWLTFPLTLI